ncbi:MAG: CopG family ribbon-helix-helix protein [Candidatus Anammoxibacter sp.]
MATTHTNEKELVSFRFHKTLKRKLANLAEATGRSQTFLAEEAIKQYCELQSWQVEAISKGIEAAENGRFVSHEKIKEKWELKRENLMD